MPYRGINCLSLASKARRDPRWLSFKQLLGFGWWPLPGARHSLIEFWQWRETVALRDRSGREIAGPGGKPLVREVTFTRPRVRYWRLFNMEDLASPLGGTVPAWDPSGAAVDRAAAAFDAVAATGARIVAVPVRGAGVVAPASYSASKDAVLAPPAESSASAGGYFSGLFRALARWAMRPGRIEGTGGGGGSRGPAAEARNDLVSDLASWMMGLELGVEGRLPFELDCMRGLDRQVGSVPHQLARAAATAEIVRGYLMGFSADLVPWWRRSASAFPDAPDSGSSGPVPGCRGTGGQGTGPAGRGSSGSGTISGGNRPSAGGTVSAVRGMPVQNLPLQGKRS
jgi:antirestriction protein ArdC